MRGGGSGTGRAPIGAYSLSLSLSSAVAMRGRRNVKRKGEGGVGGKYVRKVAMGSPPHFARKRAEEQRAWEARNPPETEADR